VSEQSIGKLRAISMPVFICVLLAAATLAVFWPVTGCDFVNYDDPDYFFSNVHVRAGLTWNGVAWAFRTVHASNWHPLTWLSLMLDAELFGKGAAGPHFTNLLFHAANTVLLFLLLRKLTAAVWRSAFVAALFALHPLHVESVAWISERKDVLSAFFALLALLAYARFVEESKVQSPKSKVFYVLVLFAFACGLMAKPMLVTLPFVMLLLDWWPLQRISNPEFQMANFRRLLWEKIPFFVLSAISCVITFVVQKKSGAVATLTGFSMPARIENTFVSYARYLGKALWPDPLAVPYPFPDHWKLSLVIYSAALMAGLSAIAILFARKFPFAFTGWFWFVGTLVPVVGVVQVGHQSMADRYTYLPLIGLFIIFAWGAGECRANWRVPRPLFVFLAATILAACAARARIQTTYWQNSETLFTHALAVTEDNYVACNNLGTWFSNHGQIAAAMDCYRQSLQIKADNPDVLYDLGNAFSKIGEWDAAIDNYHRALQVTPDQADILDNLGFALAAKKQFPEAITNFEAALKLDPDFPDAHNNLATVLFMEHHFEEAAQHYREAIRLTPDNAQIYANLGDTLARQGNIPEAMQNYQTALRLKPDDAKTRAKLQALGAHISN
jgi:tetratricopeptide (TPR) repeat protein